MLCCKEKVKLCIELGDKHGYAKGIGSMGNIFNSMGIFDKAMKCYIDYKNLSEELGNKRGYSIALCNLGNVYTFKGEYAKALDCYTEYQQISKEIGNKKSSSIALGNIGSILSLRNEDDLAMKYLDEAIKIGKELDLKVFLSNFLIMKARLHLKLNQIKEAILYNEEARGYAKVVKNKSNIFEAKILELKIKALSSKKLVEFDLLKLVDNQINPKNIARVHYEIFQINQSDKHRLKALEIYKELYKKIPYFEYNVKIEELLKK